MDDVLDQVREIIRQRSVEGAPPAVTPMALPRSDATIDRVLLDLGGKRDVVAVRGGPGVGKTVFVRSLAQALEAAPGTSVRTHGSDADLHAVQRTIGAAIGLGAEASGNTAALLQAWRADGGALRLILVFDDADRLPATTFQCLHLMVQLLGGGGNRLQIVVVGKLGAWPVLDDPALETMRQATLSPHVIFPAAAMPAAIPLRRPALHTVAAAGAVAAAAGAMAMFAIWSGGGTPPEPNRMREQAAAIIPAPSIPPVVAIAPVAVIQQEAALSPDPPHTLPHPAGLPVAPAEFAGSLPGADAEPARLADRAEPAAPEQSPVEHALAEVVPPRPAEDHSPQPVEPAQRRRGAAGLILVAGAGDSMPALYARVYRGIKPPPCDFVLAANRAPIKPGSIVIFPEPPDGWNRP